ncbi:MAG: MlaE family lipid ABC transporter permease subunit, partial [Candidatus Binatia bacterium]
LYVIRMGKLDVLTTNQSSGTLALAQLREQILERAASGSRIVLDLGGVHTLNSLEAAALLRLVSEGKEKGVEVRFSGVSAELRQAFTGLDANFFDYSGTPAERLSPVEQVGSHALEWAATVRRLVGLVGEAAYWLLIAPWRGKGIRWDRTFEQIAKIGANGVPIVTFLSFLVGAVLALNGASELRQFGASIYIANLVGVSMTREMAPLITAVIVAGRSGSAVTAELGTMVVSEEIDAMQAMALNPGRFLLLPRILAFLCAVPCLTILSNLTGILGGYCIGVTLLGLGSRNYLQQTAQAVLISDLIAGLVKSVVFALLIGLVACYRGFNVRGGAAGVGTNTTASVVSSIVLCIIADAVFTTIFFYLE